MGSFPCLFKKAAYAPMNLCACDILSVLRAQLSSVVAGVYLDVLDSNTTHFVGFSEN